jgi:tetratricopeptide (TPR) repeat protein
MALCQYMLDGKRNNLKLFDNLQRLRGDKLVLSDCVNCYNSAVLLLHSKFFEKALDLANDLFDIASDLPHWLAVRTGLLIAELGLQLSREEGELSPQISNRVTYSLDWIDARISLPKPPASDGQAPEGRALKLALHTYRAKFALVSGQKNTCKRELKAASDVLDNSQGMCLAVVRAQLHFSLSDYTNALELIGSIANLNDHSHDDQSNAAIYYNNLGCIQHKMKKFNAATYYFTKALNADEKAMHAASKGSLSTSNSQRYYEILYNLGISLLGLGKSQLAFDCFNEALQCPRFGWWRYWIRIAEAVVDAQMTLLKRDRRKYKNNLGVESGSGDRSRIILPASYTSDAEAIPYVGSTSREETGERTKKGKKGNNNNNNNSNDGNNGPNSGNYDSLSLRYALECLVNARALLKAGEVSPNPQPSSADEGAGACIRGPPRSHLSDATALVVCLLEIAYLSLMCEDPGTALHASREALTLTADAGVPSDYSHLAHVYAAEALTMLNRYDEALVHLNPPSPSEAADEASILAKGVGGMRVVLYTNYVCVLIFRGELERAQAVLQAALQLTTNPCPDLYLLQAYLTLKRGDKKSVVLLLKRGRPLPRRAPKK